ncbi:hypothetical protein [Psychromonas sp. KJ10-2]|uniref:hypothetical protein n=1 Tax=Psychromonas sp. KJ10-2 TaxID=3391822 RepID=UPI0039B3E011
MRKIISILVPLLFSMATQATVINHSTSGQYTSSVNSIGNVQTFQDYTLILLY